MKNYFKIYFFFLCLRQNGGGSKYFGAAFTSFWWYYNNGSMLLRFLLFGASLKFIGRAPRTVAVCFVLSRTPMIFFHNFEWNGFHWGCSSRIMRSFVDLLEWLFDWRSQKKWCFHFWVAAWKMRLNSSTWVCNNRLSFNNQLVTSEKPAGSDVNLFELISHLKIAERKCYSHVYVRNFNKVTHVRLNRSTRYPANSYPPCHCIPVSLKVTFFYNILARPAKVHFSPPNHKLLFTSSLLFTFTIQIFF